MRHSVKVTCSSPGMFLRADSARVSRASSVLGPIPLAGVLMTRRMARSSRELAASRR